MKFFTQSSLWTVNLYLKSYIFCLHFILYLQYMCGSVFRIRIRIQKGPEFGSNADLDPQKCCQHNNCWPAQEPSWGAKPVVLQWAWSSTSVLAWPQQIHIWLLVWNQYGRSKKFRLSLRHSSVLVKELYTQNC